jgi:hypothetical protein
VSVRTLLLLCMSTIVVAALTLHFEHLGEFL